MPVDDGDERVRAGAPAPTIRVLVAPDKFKGTLSAAGVAACLAAGLRAAGPGLEVTVVPVADGGDGTVDAAVAAGFERESLSATGPAGVPLTTCWARRGPDAVVELADASGLARVPHGALAPLTATSRGTGEVIAAALDAGCRRIVVGIGGSASTDGGVGLLQALGVRVLDADGHDVGPGGAGLEAAARLDLTGRHPALADAELVVACDVDNPLTGVHGAAAVYGPQKGATAEQVERLDAALDHWADLVANATGADRRDEPGAGAAGGVGFGLLAVAGAHARPGAELVFELTGLHDALAGADLVVTGEGSLDEQTLRGKAPAAVAAAARAAGVPVVGVAGRCSLDADRLVAAGFREVHTTADEAQTLEESMRAPGPLLERIGRRLGTALVADRGGHDVHGSRARSTAVSR
ncbi:glycerate kinase [Terracoccus luteus]|uniref:Glycerate kinase n=1 Tax=Terracoccus luteus TaxID=53356 RepID=A0A495XT85_9MICO|nr:glycerate kinase [Terracoccus luteus]RKT77132.1 glycerate kinase [Terracoccus luteus]